MSFNHRFTVWCLVKMLFSECMLGKKKKIFIHFRFAWADQIVTCLQFPFTLLMVGLVDFHIECRVERNHRVNVLANAIQQCNTSFGRHENMINESCFLFDEHFLISFLFLVLCIDKEGTY